MRTESADDIAKRRTIQHFLTTEGDFKPRDAERLARGGLFEGLTTDEALEILRTFVALLGTWITWVILEARPTAILWPIKRLKTRHALLYKEGLKSSDIANVFAKHIDILSMQDEAFIDTLDALRELLANDHWRCKLIQDEPAVLKMPAEHIRSLVGQEFPDLNTLWRALKENIDGSILNGTVQPVPMTRTLRPPAIPIAERLQSLGIERMFAEQVAIRLFNAFNGKANNHLDTFFERGWSAADVKRLVLNERNVGWRSDLDRMWKVEDGLRVAGFEATIARNLAIDTPRLNSGLYARIPDAIATFRELGYDTEEALVRIVKIDPKALLAEPDKIRKWHKEMLDLNREPLAYLRTLTTYKPPSTVRPKPHKPIADVATRTIVAPPPVMDPPPDAIIESTAPEEVLTEPVSSPPTVPIKSSPLLMPKTAQITIPPADNDPTDAPPAPTVPPARFGPPMLPPPPLPTPLPPPPPLRVEANLDMAVEDDEDDEDLNEEEDDEEEIQDSHAVDWKKILKDLLCTNRDDSRQERAWRKFAETNGWMWDHSGPAPRALNLLAHWLNVTNVRNHDNPGLQCLRKIVMDPDLHPILKLTEPAFQHRMAALRAVVKRDFVRDPQFLLLKWEDLPPSELRYRVNEVNDRGKNAHLKPYIFILLELTRERFLLRLNQLIKANAHHKEAPVKRLPFKR